MHKRLIYHGIALGIFPLCVLSLSLSVSAQQPSIKRQRAGEQTVNLSSKDSRLEITEKFSRVVELKKKITRVDGFDPEVINVSALTPNRVRVQAITPGVTTMLLVDENGQEFSIEIFVSGDARHLQAYLNEMFPQSSVKAVKVRDSVVLRGWVTQPENITEMVEIAEQFFPQVLNQMKVGGVQQVLLKVKIMEIQRSKIRTLGINWLFRNRNSYLSSSPGDITPLAVAAAPIGGPAAAGLNSTLFGNATAAFGIVNDSFSFQTFMDALKEEALLKILAEPELVTTNGRPANLLSGGEFPILVPQSLGTVTIEWREFGTRLEAVPIILGNGRLRLDLQPEVSERDFTNAVDVQGFTVPGLTTRRVNTQVEMRFGQTLMIAGLIGNRRTTETDKIPFFGELPWIGAAFRRVRDNDSETELVIMVTPELVAPIPPDQLPPGGPGMHTSSPTDRELYGMGLLEVPNYNDSYCPDCEEQDNFYAPNGTVEPSAMPSIPAPPEASLRQPNPQQLQSSSHWWKKNPLRSQTRPGPQSMSTQKSIQQVGFDRVSPSRSLRPISTTQNKPQSIQKNSFRSIRKKPGLIEPQ